MTTPQEIIRAWCASCGMAEPSNGDVAALLSLLFPDVPSVQWHDACGQSCQYSKAVAMWPEHRCVGQCQYAPQSGEMLNCETCDGSGRVGETIDVDVPGHNRAGSYHVTVTCDDCGGVGKVRANPDPQDDDLLVSAYRLAASLTGDQSLLVMELANRFARLSGKSAGEAQ